MLHINLSLPLTVSFFLLSFSFMKWQNLFRFHTFLPYSSFFIFVASSAVFLVFPKLCHLFVSFPFFLKSLQYKKNMVFYRPSFHFRRFSLRNKSWWNEKFRKNRVCEKIKCVRYLHQVIAKSKDRKLFCKNIEHWTSNIEHRTSNIEHRTSNIEHRTSNIAHQTSNLQKIKNTTSQNILQSC